MPIRFRMTLGRRGGARGRGAFNVFYLMSFAPKYVLWAAKFCATVQVHL